MESVILRPSRRSMEESMDFQASTEVEFTLKAPRTMVWAARLLNAVAVFARLLDACVAVMPGGR